VTALAPGVKRVDRRDGPPWVAGAHLLSRPLSAAEDDAQVLRPLAVAGFPAERCAGAEPVSGLDGRAVVVTGFVPASDGQERRTRGESLVPSSGAARQP
jgi:hypothetical protein